MRQTATAHVSSGLRFLRVAAVHIDVIEQLASLVHVHLRIDMADVGLRGVGRDDEFFRNVVDGVSARDVLENLALALRKGELLDRSVADLLDLGRSRRRLGQLYDGAFLAKQRDESHRKQAEEEDGRAG